MKQKGIKNIENEEEFQKIHAKLLYNITTMR